MFYEIIFYLKNSIYIKKIFNVQKESKSMIPERVFEGDLETKTRYTTKKTANSGEESLFMFYYDYCNNNALYQNKNDL